MPQDLVKFGLIPEFIGRVPVTVSLKSLNEEALVKILTEPKNALIKQYQKLFKFDGVDLELDDDAVEAEYDIVISMVSPSRIYLQTQRNNF